MMLLKVKVNNPFHKFKITLKEICIPYSLEEEEETGGFFLGTLSYIVRPYLKKKNIK